MVRQQARYSPDVCMYRLASRARSCGLAVGGLSGPARTGNSKEERRPQPRATPTRQGTSQRADGFMSLPRPRTGQGDVPCLGDSHHIVAGGDGDVKKAEPAQVGGEQLGGSDLAVDQPDAGAAGQGSKVVDQVVVIGVAGEAVDLDDVDPLVPGATVEADRRPTLEQPPPQAARRLVADQCQGGPRVVDAATQVAHDPPAVAHSA